ncbi:hypothetical protein LINGRAHAP2_LOCUS7592 [Linum grandiflorum]
MEKPLALLPNRAVRLPDPQAPPASSPCRNLEAEEKTVSLKSDTALSQENLEQNPKK